jgi:peptide/nickel transport system substrate-binding protein
MIRGLSRSPIVAVALTLILLVMVSGKAYSASPQAKIHLGGTLTAARAADAILWDPANVNENDSLWAEQQVEGTLIKVTPNGKSFEPYIADKWMITKSGRVFTFDINPKAKFCNGTPITAADVLYSLKRESAKNAVVSWQYPGLKTITAPNGHTVVLTLSSPSGVFISYMTLWGTAIVSKAYAQKVGAKGLADKPMGSGPFCLVRWQKGQEIDLKRNPYYWLKDSQGNRLPYLDAIHWKIIQDDNARVLALESGQVQVITPVPPAQFNQLSSVAHIKTGSSPLLGTSLLYLNVRKGPLSDVHVRQAMNYAVDRTAIIKSVLFGHGTPAMSPYDLANWSTGKYGYTYNLTKAKQLMAKSKYPKGFTTSVNYASGDTLAAEALVIVKAELAKIGITLNIKPLEAGALNAAEVAGKFDSWYNLGTGDIYDPAENLHFEMLPPSAGGNAGYTGWSNSTVTRLVQEAERTTNVQARIKDYHTIERIYMQTGPNLWLYNPQNLWATRDTVHGFQEFKTGKQDFEHTWIQ